jgi:antirestriction protein ArdC
MARTALTKEEREAKRAAEREQVKAAVEVLQSSEGWQAWVRVRRRFRTYSPLNQLLIALQKPDATHVAGFKAWLNLGYCVRKGEKAIRIYAPVPPSKKQVEEWKANGAIASERPRTFFTLTAVFDRSQVDVLPDREPVDVDVAPPAMVRVEGDELAWTWPLLVQFAHVELQLAMVVEDLPAGGPDGYLSPRERRIVVAQRLPLNERAAVSFHELAHALVRVEREADGFPLNYASEELVVETVAYIVASTLGIDTTASSIPYLASWAQSAPIVAIEHAAKLIDTIAGRIESALLEDDGQPRVPADPAERCHNCAGAHHGDGHMCSGCAARLDQTAEHAHLAAELPAVG